MCSTSIANAVAGWQLWDEGNRADAIPKFAAAMRGCAALTTAVIDVSVSVCSICCIHLLLLHTLPRVCARAQAALVYPTASVSVMVHVAQGESDAVLANWAREGTVQAVCSDDSDQLAYGSRLLCKLDRKDGACLEVTSERLCRSALLKGLQFTEVVCILFTCIQ